MNDPQSDGCRNPVDVVSQRRVAAQRQNPFRCGHEPSLQPADDTWPSPRRHLWMNANLGTPDKPLGMSAFENHVPQLTRDEEPVPIAKKTPEKGTTPARGGGGGGRRVSAPGGRADAHPAISRVMLTIHTLIRRGASAVAGCNNPVTWKVAALDT